MFRSLLLVAIGVAAALGSQAAQRPQQPIRLLSGQTYVYSYESRLMTGIPSLGQQFSGLELNAKVVLQAVSDAVVAMKITDVRVGKHNGPVGNDFPAGDVIMDHQVHAQFQKELTKSVRFAYQDGKVKAFEADQSEPEWSLNMKKALLSLLNVDLQPKKIIRSQKQSQNSLQQLIQRSDELTVYPVYEEGIGGLCETVYELHNSPDPKNADPETAFVLNVTKTRNYDNCLTEPTIVNDNYDVRGCPWVCRKEKSFSAVRGYYPTPDAVQDPYMSGCPCGKEPHESPVDSYSFAKYNISLIGGAPHIEGVYAEGKTSYKNNGDEILVITQQNLTLTQSGAANVQIGQIPRPQRHNELSFRIPKPQLPKGYKLPLDIPYYHLFGQPEPQELQNLIPELLDSLASDIASEEVAQNDQIGQKTVQMVNAMAVLSQHQLQQLFEQVAQEGASQRATPKQQVVRKLFLDALPLAGSNDAALAIKSLIVENKVTTSEAKEMVEAVPQNLFLPDSETIDAYLELFQEPKVQARRHLAASTGIAFGKMVKEGCVKRQQTPGDIPDGQLPHPKRNQQAQAVVQGALPQQQRVTVSQRTSGAFSPRMKRSTTWEAQFSQDVCDQEDVQKYVTIVGRLLASAQTFHQKVTLIETLAHMAVPQSLPILEPYISGSAQQSGECPGYPVENSNDKDEECDFIRQVAIYALAHVAEQYPKQVAPLVLPVYSDQSEAYEVRIAAFTTLLLAQPSKQQLERIASELHRENSRQIRSFVYSALNTMANISAPCFQHLSQHAQQAVQHAPQADYGYQYSQMVGKGFFDENKDFGLYTLAEWTANNISRVPRAGYVSVGQSSGPFQDELIQIGFQSKGMESLLERVLEPNGIVSDMFESMHAKPRDRRVNKRNADSAQQALEALKSKLNLELRSDDEPKATVFFKLFDRTSYYALDKHYMHQVIDNAEDYLKDMAQTLMQGQQMHYVKLVMPSSIYKVVPSELGLPVVISHRHPLILSLKVDQAKLQVEVSPKTVYPTGANITAQITPSVFYSSQTFAFAVNPADRQAFGTHVQKTTQIQLPVEVSVGYSRPKNLVTWSVIPKTEQNQEIVFHQTKSQTFIARAAISGAPDSDWLQNAEPIKSQAVPFKHSQTYGQEAIGLGVRVEMTSEDVWSQQPITSGETYEEHGIAASLVQAWRNPGLKAREVHVQLEADREEPISGYDFTLRYKWIEDSENSKDSDDSDESSASDESDSDQSDESSDSESSESKSSASDSSSDESKSSDSSNSSEKSNESKNKSLKKRINRRMNKNIQSNESNSNSKNRSKRSANKESNESSDESSNESGSKSWSKSGSKESSQSSSSESSSSEEKSRNKSKNSRSNSHSASAQSSESSSSSSSQSDESKSLEDAVFDYEDVMQLILGQDFQRKSIKKVSKQLIRKTANIWSNNWDEDEDQSSSDESNEEESSLIPQTISHDIAITATARGPRPTYYAANVLYVHTYDHRISWLKTDGHIKAPKGVYMTTPTLFCADAVVSYPTLPNEFYYEPQMASQQARMQAQIGWGQQCREEGGVLITGVMEQTEDHVVTEEQFAAQDGVSGAQVQNWFFQQCQVDRSEGRSGSYACERAIIASSYFNQFIVDIKYKNIPKQIQNWTHKADLALKVALYDHLDNNQLEENAEEQIRVKAQYSQRIPDIPLVNLEIQSPQETQQYQQIHVPYIRPISALLPTQRVFKNLYTGFESRAQCHLMEDFVRTFDNVTFQMPESPCQYLLAKDCSPKERFAVFAQQLSTETKTKSVTILCSGSEIKLLPPQQQNVAQVVIDGHAHELTYRKPVTLIGDKNNLRVYLRATPSEANNPIVVVESDIDQLEVLYDGKNAKVAVGGQYGGRTCGLCGDNNDETDEEFAGPDQCQYEEAEDFANSYALSGEHCEQKALTRRGEKRCQRRQENSSSEESAEGQIVTKKQVIQASGPNGQTTLVRHEQEEGNQENRQRIQTQSNVEEIESKKQQMSERQMQRQNGRPVTSEEQETLVGGDQQQQKLIQRLRTTYIERDEMICFSVKPVLSCIQNNSRATAFNSVQTDFHCLPKSSPFTQQLIRESQQKAIKQLSNKRVDLRQVIQVPSKCIAIAA